MTTPNTTALTDKLALYTRSVPKMDTYTVEIGAHVLKPAPNKRGSYERGSERKYLRDFDSFEDAYLWGTKRLSRTRDRLCAKYCTEIGRAHV